MLKAISTADLPDMGLPADPADCAITVDVEVGPRDSDISEKFSFLVVTSQHLVRSELPRWGHGLLVVEEFTWAEVGQMVAVVIAAASRESWAESVIELRRILR